MAPLIGLALIGLLGSEPPRPPDAVARWTAEIDAAATRCGVPASWIARVMRAESGGRTVLDGRPIRSPKGAIGLMQLMPATWGQLRRELGLGDDPDQPRDNIVAGACYLQRMHDRFGYPGLFAAYNAGPARYTAWLDGRAALPGETLAYLRNVGGPEARAGTAPMGRADPLFLVRREASAPSSSMQVPVSGEAIFVLRRTGP